MFRAVALAAIAVAVSAAAGGAATVPTTARVLAFAQDGGHAAWLGGPCLEVHEGALGAPQATVLGDAEGDQCMTMAMPLLALAGRRALWTDVLSATDGAFTDVWTGAPGSEEQLIEELASDPAYHDGDVVSAIGGDGSNLVYSVVTLAVPASCRVGGACGLTVVDGRMMLVTPKAKVRYLAKVPPATRVALAGDTIAVVPVAPGAAQPDSLPASRGFGLYRISNGKELARVPVAAPILGLAASPSAVAVLTRGRIALYASPSGKQLSATAVPVSATDVSVSGTRVVYRTGNTIRLLGSARPLAVAHGAPVGLSVDGSRVAWADRGGGSGGHIHELELSRP